MEQSSRLLALHSAHQAWRKVRGWGSGGELRRLWRCSLLGVGVAGFRWTQKHHPPAPQKGATAALDEVSPSFVTQKQTDVTPIAGFLHRYLLISLKLAMARLSLRLHRPLSMYPYPDPSKPFQGSYPHIQRQQPQGLSSRGWRASAAGAPSCCVLGCRE